MAAFAFFQTRTSPCVCASEAALASPSLDCRVVGRAVVGEDVVSQPSWQAAVGLWQAAVSHRLCIPAYTCQ